MGEVAVSRFMVGLAVLLVVSAFTPMPAAAQVSPTAAVQDQPTDTSGDGEVIEMTDTAPDTGEPVTYELTPDVIRKMPGSGNDAIKSLQTLPSVGRVPFGMGGLILRGTSPRDSNVYIDGIAVPLLYHFGGLASFYPSSLIESLQLTPGGYSVEYGRGQGGVVTLRSRAGRSDRWRVGSELSMIDASVRADGPSGDYGSWSIALRRSYIDAVLPLVNAGGDGITNAPRYMDAQLRYDVELWRNASLTALLFGSDDQIGVQYGVEKDKSFNFDTRFARFGLRFQQRHNTTTVTISPWVGIDRYHLASSFQTMTSKNRPAGVRGQLAHDAGYGSVRIGIDVATADFEVDSVTVTDETMLEITRADTYVDAAVWLDSLVRVADGKIAIKPGIRLDHFGLAGAVALDPRIVVTEQVSRRISLRQSLGTFHQPPTPADSLWGNEDLGSSYSVQSSFGGRVSLGAGAYISLSGFYSELYDLAVDDPDADDSMLNNLQTYKIGALASSREFISKQFGTFSELANIGRGRVYGTEVMGQYIGARGFAWLAYTFSRSWRTTGDLPRHRWVLDQPHVVTAVGSLAFGDAWRVGSRFRFASGNPITPLIGRTQVAVDEYEPIFGDEMSERLPAFAQFDVRIDREWKRSWGTVTAFVDVQNASRRVNIEGRVYEDDYSGFEPTNGLPLFPSVGVTYSPASN